MRSVPTWEALKKENQLRAQRKRVAVGEEEQGSGRMTSFCHRHKKTSEQSGLCSDVEHRNSIDANKNLLIHWRLDEHFAENYGRSFVFRSNGKSLGQMKNFLFHEKRIKILVLQLFPF